MDRRQFLVRSAVASLGGLLPGGCGGSDGGGGPSPAAPAAASPPLPGETIVIALAGSSSVMQYVSHFAGPASNARVQVTRDGTNFAPLQSGAFGKVAGDALVQATGQNVIFIDGGVSGATLASWAAPSSPHRRQLVSRIRAAGGADLLLLQAGWNDAASGAVRSREAQSGLFHALIGAIRSEAALPGLPVLLAACQNLHSGAARWQDQLALQRLAELDAAASIPDVTYAFSTYDLPTYDGIHQSEQAQLLAGQRFAEQAIARLAGQPSPRGPRAAAVTQVSDSVTQIQLNLADGTGFMPASGLDGFFVQDAAGLSAATSAIRIDDRTIQLMHRPLDMVEGTIRYALDARIGLPGCVRDTSALARPMEPMLLPVSNSAAEMVPAAGFEPAAP